tara:strand:+ start:74 stop:370 length:297 start_codon:yes stop_codon:yes gene_type:complete
LDLSSKQRKYLRALAHDLKPKVYIGKNSINEGTINSINENLDAHELIKIKSHENKLSLDDLSDIKNQTNFSIVGNIGKTIIVYRENADKELRKIKLPK